MKKRTLPIAATLLLVICIVSHIIAGAGTRSSRRDIIITDGSNTMMVYDVPVYIDEAQQVVIDGMKIEDASIINDNWIKTPNYVVVVAELDRRGYKMEVQ